MDKSEALELARQYLRDSRRLKDDSFAFYDDRCLQRAYGWVVYYNSRKFIETGDVRHAFLGSVPLVIADGDRGVYPISARVPLEEALRGFERQHGLITCPPDVRVRGYVHDLFWLLRGRAAETRQLAQDEIDLENLAAYVNVLVMMQELADRFGISRLALGMASFDPRSDELDPGPARFDADGSEISSDYVHELFDRIATRSAETERVREHDLGESTMYKGIMSTMQRHADAFGIPRGDLGIDVEIDW